ncbi:MULTISPECIES: hypothetical protein [Streptomyces]|uniref:hypothetical protein n=1 Tax=Streptomyces TaxID=1883 RepID=UPI001FF30D27|nr:hypothetical protein [Streptomyces sp. AgN23]WTA84059.1 hypothetical protein OG751_31600 [Streptomyces antimycoticus]
MAGGAFRGYPQSERKSCAQPGQFGELPFVIDRPVSRGDDAQQGNRLRLRQHTERESAGPVPDREAGQAAAAGDQHQAVCAPGQQRPDLADCGRVVQDDQYPTVGQQRAV